MGPGEIIGCAAVFHQIPYPATATATIDSIVMSWTASQFENLLQDIPNSPLTHYRS